MHENVKSPTDFADQRRKIMIENIQKRKLKKYLRKSAGSAGINLPQISQINAEKL